MIIKKRQLPASIQKLQSLLRRLPRDHAKIPLIQETLAKQMAGYRGEHSIDYPLSFLPEDKYSIIHDLRLPHNEFFFQIDTLLLSHHFILILEVKNIAGKLYFDQDFHQLVRTLEGKDETFPDPLLQVRRHELQFKSWLSKHKFPHHIPVETLVVISNPYSQIQSSNQAVHQKVIHRDALPFKVHQLELLYKNRASFNDKELKKIIRSLLKQHQSSSTSFREQFNIDSSHILKGVHCPDCGLIPMQRVHGTWLCSNCRHTCKTAHIEALRDYSFLLKPTITNREAREFLLINSKPLASRLLHSLSAERDGVQRGSFYHLPTND